MEASPITVFEVSNLGIQIRGQICGSGHPIVFLHGFPEFCGVWNQQVACFSPHYLTIAPDLRGFNHSDKPRGMEHYSAEALASDVLAILDQLNCGPATVVGHDIGGLAAWWLAGNVPHKVDSLVLVSSPHPADYLTFRAQHPEIRNYWDEILDGNISELMVPERLTFWAREEERDGLLEAVRHTDFEAVRSIYRKCLGRNCLPEWLQLPKIAVPSLVIYGEADEFIPAETHAGIQKWFVAPATIVKLTEGRHFLHSRMGDRINIVLKNWLSETRQKR